MNKKIVLLSCVLISASEAFKVEISNVDDQGRFGESKDAIIFPHTDVSLGGSSIIFDPEDNNVVSECPIQEASCSSEKGFSSVFIGDEYHFHRLSSKIKITDYVPSSKPSWGWASAGWWIIPSYDSAVVSENIFDKAKAAGLNKDSWISMLVLYEKGQTLTLQLAGDGIDENDTLQSPPRFSYEGTGKYDQVSFPVKAIKRAVWSIPDTYDISKITAIGLVRREEALSEGSEFPKSILETTELEFVCMAFGSSKGDIACGGDLIDPILTSSEGITLLGKEVKVYSVSGEQIWSGLWAGSLDGFSRGLYFVKWNNQVLKFNHD
jgi:hypothetical protein